MSRRGGLIVVAIVLTSLLFARVSTSGGVDLWQEPQWEPAPVDDTPIEIESPSEQSEPPPPNDDSDRSPIELPEWLQAIFRVLFVTLVIVTVVALTTTAWRRRPRLRWHRRSSGDGDFDALPDVAAAVVEEAATQRAALLSGAPRNAIVQCWLRLEHDVAAVGLHRRAADTSVEFTERVLARYTVDPAAIGELAALYREARFSDHELDESSRQAALSALDRLHAALSESISESVDGSGDEPAGEYASEANESTWR